MYIIYTPQNTKMSSHISLTINPTYTSPKQEMEKMAADYDDEYSFERNFNMITDTLRYSHVIYIGRGGCWARYRDFLLNLIAKNEYTDAVLEMDRDGDCMDKNVKYVYRGDGMFHVTYKTDDISYTSEMRIKV